MVSFGSFYNPTSSNSGFSPPKPPSVTPSTTPSQSTPSTPPPPGTGGGRGQSTVAPPTTFPNSTPPPSLPSTPGITPGGSPTPSVTPPPTPTPGALPSINPSNSIPKPNTLTVPPPNGPPTGPGLPPGPPSTPPGGIDNNNPTLPPALPDTGKGGVDNPGPPPIKPPGNNNFEMPGKPDALIPANTVKQDDTAPEKTQEYIPPEEKSGDADKEADKNNFDGKDLETAREEADKDLDNIDPTDLNIPTSVEDSDLSDVQDDVKDSTENKVENADPVIDEDQKEKRKEIDEENAKKEDAEGKQDESELKCPKALDENGDAKGDMQEEINETEEKADNPSEDATPTVDSNEDTNDDSASNQDQPEEFTIEEEYNWFEPKNNLFNKLLPNGLGIKKGYKRTDPDNPFDPNTEAEYGLFSSDMSDDFFWDDSDVQMGEDSWAFNVNFSHGALNTYKQSTTFTPASTYGDSNANGGYNKSTTSSSSSDDYVNIKAEYINKRMLDNGDISAIKIGGQYTPNMSQSDFDKINNYNQQKSMQNSAYFELRHSSVDMSDPLTGGLKAVGGLLDRIPGICWVAREVYGPYNPQWLQFREWMFSESPQWFFNLYRKYGERFANWISDKPRIKAIIRKWMDSRIDSL